jgi:UDP-N-acetylmuramoyl-L-alanyl-D-glutamate--2,6-diaminopimelate ligase
LVRIRSYDRTRNRKQLARITEAKLTGDETIVITDVSHDSRRAGKGNSLRRRRGRALRRAQVRAAGDGQGAAGVLSERPAPENFSGAWLQVANIRRAMALAAAEVQHHPSRELQLVGITGTNGKTTTAYLIASIPEAAGELVAMTGTVEYRLGKERFKADRTTPEAPDMQRCCDAPSRSVVARQ